MMGWSKSKKNELRKPVGNQGSENLHISWLLNRVCSITHYYLISNFLIKQQFKQLAQWGMRKSLTIVQSFGMSNVQEMPTGHFKYLNGYLLRCLLRYTPWREHSGFNDTLQGTAEKRFCTINWLFKIPWSGKRSMTRKRPNRIQGQEHSTHATKSPGARVELGWLQLDWWKE